MVYFKVAKRGEPTVEEFKRLTAGHAGSYKPCNPFDGKEHGHIELVAWIGDQSLALQYMALGVLLGTFDLLSPKTVLNLDGKEAVALAGRGLLSIQSKEA